MKKIGRNSQIFKQRLDGASSKMLAEQYQLSAGRISDIVSKVAQEALKELPKSHPLLKSKPIKPLKIRTLVRYKDDLLKAFESRVCPDESVSPAQRFWARVNSRTEKALLRLFRSQNPLHLTRKELKDLILKHLLQSNSRDLLASSGLGERSLSVIAEALAFAGFINQPTDYYSPPDYQEKYQRELRILKRMLAHENHVEIARDEGQKPTLVFKTAYRMIGQATIDLQRENGSAPSTEDILNYWKDKGPKSSQVG